MAHHFRLLQNGGDHLAVEVDMVVLNDPLTDGLHGKFMLERLLGLLLLLLLLYHRQLVYRQMEVDVKWYTSVVSLMKYLTCDEKQ